MGGVKPDDRFDVNEAEVAAKMMASEAVMINLSNGMYYSMDGVGGFVWALIQTHGASVEEMVATVTEHYDAAEAQVRADIEALLGELVAEKLVAVRTVARDGFTPLPAAPSSRAPYETPRLNTYRDMGDLLALDPPMPGLTEIPWEGASE